MDVNGGEIKSMPKKSGCAGERNEVYFKIKQRSNDKKKLKQKEK